MRLNFPHLLALTLVLAVQGPLLAEPAAEAGLSFESAGSAEMSSPELSAAVPGDDKPRSEQPSVETVPGSTRQTSTGADKFSFAGTWEQEWAVETGDFDSQKFEAMIEPRVDVRLTESTRLTGVARIRLDAIGDLGPDESRPDNYSSINGPILNDEYAELSLREFYLDAEWGQTIWRLGKQQIVWGQADGIKVLDVVNPQSYREFILDDFDDSRIPLWSVSVESPLGDTSSLQLVWIPDTTYHELAEYGTPFFITSPKLVPIAPPGVPTDVRNPDVPDDLLQDSDLGVRLSSFLGGWDVTLNYLYHYQDAPVFYQRLESSPSGVQAIVSPEYERNHLAGGTLSNAFGDFTVRTELAYSSDTFHVSQDINEGGISDSAEFGSVLGLDWQVSSDTLISAQWFYSYLFDYDSSVIRDESEHVLSALLQSEFANAAWKFHLLSLYSTNDDDVMVQARMAYWLRGNLEVWVGSDLFYGSRDGSFGQFRDSKRLLFGFEYGF